jgi:hypothetical protein
VPTRSVATGTNKWREMFVCGRLDNPYHLAQLLIAAKAGNFLAVPMSKRPVINSTTSALSFRWPAAVAQLTLAYGQQTQSFERFG